MDTNLTTMALRDLIREHPYAGDFFLSIGLPDLADIDCSCAEIVNNLTDSVLEDCGMDRLQILNHFTVFLQTMAALKAKKEAAVHSITIIGGQDKAGCSENVELTLNSGEIICIVGPTGAGKSRLLADIECFAQGDTPTGRRVLVNGREPAPDQRFSIEHKLVAQLSQNMNFVMDLSVEEFVQMHAESRMIENAGETVDIIMACANDLAGENFLPDTPVTQLSGGQSRALMIADTALLSASPVVLIDEIENAGVDRKKALQLLVKKEKIVLMSTHDPILALMGDKRVVIKNGGINKIIGTSASERANLAVLQILDHKMAELRNRLRTGGRIDFDISEYLFSAFGMTGGLK